MKAYRNAAISAAKGFHIGANSNPMFYWSESNVVFEGHSFMSTTLQTQIEGKIKITTKYDAHIAGAVIQDVINRTATVNSKLVAETLNLRNILVLQIGTNDLTNVAGCGLIAYNKLKPYILDQLSIGWKIFFWTITPSTYGTKNAQTEIERNIFNNKVREELAPLKSFYLLDTDTIAELDDPANNLYYSDLLHATVLGIELLAELLLTKAKALSSRIEHTLSSEIISNGNFDNALLWNPDANWIISNGVAEYQKTANGMLRKAEAQLQIPMQMNTLYRLQFTCAILSGFAQMIVIPSSWNYDIILDSKYGNAVYVCYFRTRADIATSGFGFYAKTTSENKFTLDNISLKKVI